MIEQAQFIQDLTRAILVAADPTDSTKQFYDSLSHAPTAILAFGKAAIPMTQAAASLCGGLPTKTLVITTPQPTPHNLTAPAEVLFADHPLPSPRNILAAERTLEFVQSLAPADHLLVLLSGGGSSLLTLPTPPLTLDDCTTIADALMRAGCDIHELNTIRKHNEQLKGGRLAQASAVHTITIACVSDVIGDSIETIASGPFAPDTTTYDDALDILSTHNCQNTVPAITEFLREGAANKHPETPTAAELQHKDITHSIILNNQTAINAAADFLQSNGFTPRIINDFTGHAHDAGKLIAESLNTHHAVILGGEPTVSNIKPGTLGGPVQEAILAAALELEHTKYDWLIFGLATDGIDGPTQAAGAWLNPESLKHIQNPADALHAHNTYPALRTANALITTGPTGTNINDILIAIRR